VSYGTSVGSGTLKQVAALWSGVTSTVHKKLLISFKREFAIIWIILDTKMTHNIFIPDHKSVEE